MQELLPGRRPQRLLAAHVERLVELTLQQGDGGTTGRGAFIVRTLTYGADGYCLHAPLRSAPAGRAELLDRVVAIGRDTPRSRPARGRDAHFEFHHLTCWSRVSGCGGVVDWEGCRMGRPCFDLVTLQCLQRRG